MPNPTSPPQNPSAPASGAEATAPLSAADGPSSTPVPTNPSHRLAADYFALRKTFTGTKWVFSEGRNIYNPASHCDIAWAGALATHAHTQRRSGIGATLGLEYGSVHTGPGGDEGSRVAHLVSSGDSRIWRPVNL